MGTAERILSYLQVCSREQKQQAREAARKTASRLGIRLHIQYRGELPEPHQTGNFRMVLKVLEETKDRELIEKVLGYLNRGSK